VQKDYGSHFPDFNTLAGAYFDTALAADTFAGLVGVGLSIGAKLINADRADIGTLAAAGAALQIHIH
jgi:hypothetical protein